MIAGLPLLAWPGGRGDRGLLAILIYHRVLPCADALRPGEPDGARFECQMRVLSRHFAVLPLLEAAQRLRRGTLPKRACCITFDDGYADNLIVAQPILEQYRLPATVFVATGYLDGGRMFNDSVIELVARVPGPVLDLRPIGMGELSVGNVAERRATIAGLLGHLRYLPPADREPLVARMVELAGCEPLPTDLMLSTAQLVELARRGIDIGGHTVAHTILTTLDDAAARAEILGGKQGLEAIIGRPVGAFAYPNGRPQRDYTASHVAMMRESGFQVAVTTAPGIGNRHSDILQLPRFSPWGSSMPAWTARLTRNARLRRPVAVC